MRWRAIGIMTMWITADPTSNWGIARYSNNAWVLTPLRTTNIDELVTLGVLTVTEARWLKMVGAFCGGCAGLHGCR